MPRLSAYLAAEFSAPGAAQGSQQQQQPGGAAGGGGGGDASAAAPRHPHQPLEPLQHAPAQHAELQGQNPGQQQQPGQQPGLPSTAGGDGSSTPPPRLAALLDPQHEAAAARLQAEYAKRVREHGPRVFRWPDGSLRPERPLPNPNAVANRRLWAPLVQHCREGGGGLVPAAAGGAALRHGVGVEHSQHAAYLGSIGLEPEAAGDGSWVGEEPGLPAPLEDPEHCFNSFYKKGAEAVLKHKLGRLL